MRPWVSVRTAVAMLCLAGASVAKGQSDSPFIPLGARPAPAAPSTDQELEALQLSGISVIGEDQRFNFVDPKSKRSFWIALGGTESGFTVDSFDPDSDTVLVRKGSFTRRLGLRQSKIVAQTAPVAVPVIASAPGVPDTKLPGVDEIKNPKTPEQIKQAEFEARMLVSDLLEISMQERARQKALRDQQAKRTTSTN